VVSILDDDFTNLSPPFNFVVVFLFWAYTLLFKNKSREIHVLIHKSNKNDVLVTTERKKKKHNQAKRNYSRTKTTPRASSRRGAERSLGGVEIFTRGMVESAPILANTSAHALPS
jgi:hypothetical protein